ncbi:MAG: cell division protein ZapE [Pseudomonadota bacterium]
MSVDSAGVLTGYLEDVVTRGFEDDPNQRRIATALDMVAARLRALSSERGRSLWPFSRKSAPAPVRGLYIYGDVGRGKTYLMDMFHARLDEPRKLREHFHSFMKTIHEALAETRQTADPLKPIAQDIADRYRVICFDEFFVSDIADAMLLGTLFTELFERGVTLIATSNVAPDDLYRDGLQRARFLPAIAALKAHCDVLRTDGASDYRLRVLQSSGGFRTPLNEETTRALSEDFRNLAPLAADSEGALRINGRDIDYVRLGQSAAWFTFDALCRGPRGTLDYIELAGRFDTLVVSDVPLLDATLENEARRFIALIDELYDRRVNLLLSAAVPMLALYDGERLTFEFQRTYSRLQEMQSESYIATPHRSSSAG